MLTGRIAIVKSRSATWLAAALLAGVIAHFGQAQAVAQGCGGHGGGGGSGGGGSGGAGGMAMAGGRGGMGGAGGMMGGGMGGMGGMSGGMMNVAGMSGTGCGSAGMSGTTGSSRGAVIAQSLQRAAMSQRAGLAQQRQKLALMNVERQRVFALQQAVKARTNAERNGSGSRTEKASVETTLASASRG